MVPRNKTSFIIVRSDPVIGLMVRLHRYISNSDKTGYYLQDKVNGNNIPYKISNKCEYILLSFGYEDEDPIADEIFYVLHDLGFIHSDNSSTSAPKSFEDISSLDGDIMELSNKEREKFLNLILTNSELDKAMRDKLEQYAETYDIDVESDTTAVSLSSKRDSGWSSVEQFKDGPSDRAIPYSSGGSKEEFEEKDEHVEPRLLCEFCDTNHNATELLGHVAYSDDESHSSSGNVPQGFHPATASVVEEGTVQVAFPAKLRTNVNFHPICRWCGEKFYQIDRYLAHLNGDQRSFDENLHQADKQQSQIPLLVPFDRDGTVIPTTPSLTELAEDTAIENVSEKKDIPRESENQTESNNTNINTNDVSKYSKTEQKRKMNGNYSDDTDTETSQIGIDEKTNSNVKSERKENAPTISGTNEIDPGAKMTSHVKKDGKQVDNKATETSDEETVSIDSALLSLGDLIVADDTTDYNSRADLLDTALDEFLGAAIAGDQTRSECQTTTSRHFDIETDPVLGYLLTETIQNEAQFDSSEEFIQHTVFDALGIDSSTTNIVIPNYNRYEFVIEQLVQIDDYPYDTSSHIIHAALEKHIGIPNEK